jgi:hypothetical protein
LACDDSVFESAKAIVLKNVLPEKPSGFWHFWPFRAILSGSSLF